jgi:hypothetical protein
MIHGLTGQLDVMHSSNCPSTHPTGPRQDRLRGNSGRMSPPPHQRDEKPVGAGAARRYQQAFGGNQDGGAKRPCRGRRPDPRPGAGAKGVHRLFGRDYGEFRMAGEEGADLAAVLLIEQRAGVR